jgi:hypothetical protein
MSSSLAAPSAAAQTESELASANAARSSMCHGRRLKPSAHIVQYEAIVADRNSSQKYVWRARITLATADGCGTA